MKKQTLLIGIGQLGCAVADRFARTKSEDEENIHVLALDTDAKTAQEVLYARNISAASMEKISDVLDALDTDLLGEFFPCDKEKDCVEYFETLSMNGGANGWRMKAMLAFYNYLSKSENAAYFTNILESAAKNIPEEAEERSIDICTVASLSGGTGSGLFIPLTLYLKRFFAEKGISTKVSRAVLALPTMLEDQLTQEQNIKAQANAYASLRELNAITLAAAGEKADFDLKIGVEKDSVLGVLYDSNAKSSREKESAPFSSVYLIGRLPGIRSLLFHIDYMAEVLRAVIGEKESENIPHDSLYKVLSLTKTVYPAASVASYITHACVSDVTGNEYIPFFLRAARRAASDRGISYLPDTVSAEGAGELAHSLVAYVNEICPKEEDVPVCALLGREKDPVSPVSLENKAYLGALERTLEKVYGCGAQDELEAALEGAKSTVAENKKNSRNPFLSGKRRKETCELVDRLAELLTEYYTNGLGLMKSGAGVKSLAASLDSDISLDRVISDKDGRVYNPVYSLILLSSLYVKLEEMLEFRRSAEKDGKNKLTDEKIPAWLLKADENVSANGKYSTYEKDRLAAAFAGERRHIGADPADMSLICYDVGESLARIKNIFFASAIESLLPAIAEKISFFYGALISLKQFSADIGEETQDLENAHTGRAGTVYNVAATAREKKELYADYKRLLAESDDASVRGELDHALGILFETCEREGEIPSCKKIKDTLIGAVAQNAVTVEFISKQSERNVLEVLLSQNGERGADTAELALNKAFCAGTNAIRFYLPELEDSYKLMQALRRRVCAYLPIEAREYLEAHKAEYQNRTPEEIVCEILYNAGEYEATVSFDDRLEKNELRMVRECANISLCMFEPFSETSETPIYNKAYKKALYMEKEQLSAMWNPHCVCGHNDTTLPYISPLKRAEAENDNRREDDEAC